MTLTTIIILIVLGLLLILVEFLLLPGTHVAGIIGIVLILAAIIFGYKTLDRYVAHMVLTGTFVLMVGSITLSLRSKTWKKLALTDTIDSKVITVDPNTVKSGDMGKTITRLAPVGKVLIHNQSYEARSGHLFLDPNTPVEVVSVEGNQIIVKPIES